MLLSPPRVGWEDEQFFFQIIIVNFSAKKPDN
jgi:hypothetical protein